MNKKILFIIFSLLAGLVIYTVTAIPNSSSILGKSTGKNSPDYRVAFVGDSMTEYLGNFDELRSYLRKYYPNKKFLLLNYGFSSTNILSVPDRLEKATDHSGRIFEPINDIPFDLILIESFGNNPLSEYSITEGLKKQTEVLDKIINILTQKHPKSSIVFVATISPSKERYGEGVLNLLPEEKKRWVDERIAYIKNHINYAKAHNIPLINIFEKSLDQKGDGNINYLNSNDYIHPSPTGIYFISQQIAAFIYKNKLIK